MEQGLETPIFVGGSGSSGSSLFAAMLNRHPDVYCGAELSLLNKRQIYHSHERVKQMLPSWIKTGLPTDGYFLYPKILPHAERDLVKPAVLCRCSSETQTTREFIDSVQSYCLHESKKKIFAEKTPSNAYCFRQLASLYENCVLVHPIRDGRDVVCSLMRRGFDIFRATSMWLYNTSCAIGCRELSNYFEYRYEELVNNTAATLERFCARISIPVAQRMLEPNETETQPDLATVWQSSPADALTPRSIGRFKTELNDEDYALFCSVELTATGARHSGTEPYTALQMLRLLGYTAHPPASHVGRVRATYLENRDFVRRNAFLIRRGWSPRRALTRISLRTSRLLRGRREPCDS